MNLCTDWSTICFSFVCSGCVTGLLKVGVKNLYVFDENGDTKPMPAMCVLDFYVHESRQRAGLGREMFDVMLDRENVLPRKLAVDRPSEKLVAFLQKHYGTVNNYRKQVEYNSIKIKYFQNTRID